MMLTAALKQLANLYDVQLDYIDNAGIEREAQPDALVAVLRCLGAPIASAADAEHALAEQTRHVELIEPVLVAWDGVLPEFSLQTPRQDASYELHLEDGGRRAGVVRLSPQPAGRSASIVERVPLGYHDLVVEAGAQRGHARILAAPRQAHSGERSWGMFLPLYAVRSGRNHGIGDYTALGELSAWADRLGGSYIGTLPLLATFLDQPFEPSPYSPVSRLFWNEAFLDLGPVRALVECAAAAAELGGSEFTAAIERLNHGDLVDYREVARWKRRVLEPLARCFFQQRAAHDADFASFLHEYPRVRDYAAFRAATERERRGWPVWPERMRAGRLEPSDYDTDAADYHVFVQYASTRQLAGLAGRGGARLYLDLPLGVHPDGYDTWRERALFATGVSTGAPPDAFFTHGQNWGFPPMSPTAMRTDRHAYLRETVCAHLRYAGALRLDHVMSLHRLFWIPNGMKASEGVYVRYPAAELYALLCLESHRHQALIIGEDLGTVPPGVREQMAEHRIARMYVVQFEVQPQAADPLPAPPAQAVVSLNTHDMPTFEAYRRALDANLRGELGLIDQEEIAATRHARRRLIHAVALQLQRADFLHGRPGAEQVRDALYGFLAASAAGLLLINLEDLWREERPQNVPGTSAERPNWQRRTRPSLEEIMNSPEITAVLSRVNEIRSGR